MPNDPKSDRDCGAPPSRAPKPVPRPECFQCAPDHYAGAIQFLEQHARIVKLPGGNWRVWLRAANLRVYGSTRYAALIEAAGRVRGRPLSELLHK